MTAARLSQSGWHVDQEEEEEEEEEELEEEEEEEEEELVPGERRQRSFG